VLGGARAVRAAVLLVVAAAGFGLAYTLALELRSEPPRSRLELAPLPRADTAPRIQPLPRAPRRPQLHLPEPPPLVVIAPPPVFGPPPPPPPPPPVVPLPPPTPLPLPPPPKPG